MLRILPRLLYMAGYRSLFGLDFDGVDDLVNAGSDASVDNIFDGGGTVGAWVHLRTVGENGGQILSKRNASVGWFLNVYTGDASNSKLNLAFYFTGGIVQWAETTGTVTYDQWNFIACAFNADDTANNPTLYINNVVKTVGSGVTESIAPSGTRVDDAANSLFLGNQFDTNWTTDGVIADAFLANRILTADELSMAYNGGRPRDLLQTSFADALVAYYPMGYGVNYPTVIDYAGVNNGTMTNMALNDIVAGVDG